MEVRLLSVSKGGTEEQIIIFLKNIFFWNLRSSINYDNMKFLFLKKYAYDLIMLNGIFPKFNFTEISVS